jgi:hypothetical protein
MFDKDLQNALLYFPYFWDLISYCFGDQMEAPGIRPELDFFLKDFHFLLFAIIDN